MERHWKNLLFFQWRIRVKRWSEGTSAKFRVSGRQARKFFTLLRVHDSKKADDADSLSFPKVCFIPFFV